MGHTTRQLQHPRHHRHIGPTNVTADNTTYARTAERARHHPHASPTLSYTAPQHAPPRFP